MIQFRRGMGSSTPGASQAIASAAAQYGIDPNLLAALARQESGLNQSAVSPAGAIGVMQLMPGTAASLGCDPTSLIDNIDCGAKYLAQLLAKYDGNESLALAAYNAGPGAVAKYGGVPPYTETQNYVSNILNSVGNDLPTPLVGPTPAQLGFDTTGLDSTSPSTLDFSQLADLSSGSYAGIPYWGWAGIAAAALALVYVATE